MQTKLRCYYNTSKILNITNAWMATDLDTTTRIECWMLVDNSKANSNDNQIKQCNNKTTTGWGNYSVNRYCNYQQVMWLPSLRSKTQALVCLPVHGTPDECYYNTVLFCCNYFPSSSVVPCTFSACNRQIQSLGIILIPYATFVPNFVSFTASIAELANREKSGTQSLTHQAYLMPRQLKHLHFGISLTKTPQNSKIIYSIKARNTELPVSEEKFDDIFNCYDKVHEVA